MLRIGKIVAAHGLQGEVILTHVLPNNKWLRKEMPLFVALRKGSRIPFFVQSFRGHEVGSAILRFDEVDDATAAKALVGHEVYSEEKELAAAATTETPLLWIGFEVSDKTLGVVGRLEDVYQTPSQWLGALQHEGREVLIPLIEPVLIHVDIKKQTVHVDLPEGIMEV